MTSRERILNAISCKPVDHVPLVLRFWPMGGKDTIPFRWKSQVHRVEDALARGLDDTLLLQPPLGYIEDYRADLVPGVATSVLTEPARPGEEYPVLHKEYQTAGGSLVHAVHRTDDWVNGDDVYLFSDFNVSRAVRHAVQTEEDLRVLPHLLGMPSPPQIEEFHKEAAYLSEQSRRLGAALDGGWVALGDAAVMLSGMERILLAQMEEPDFLQHLLDILCAWETGRIELLLAQGVDMIVHMAWYEGTDFWTPANYRAFLLPRLTRMVEQVHAGGAKYRYIITKGLSPLLGDIIDAGVDCIMGLDPVQDRVDLAAVKRQAVGRLCLMGGVNSPIMLSQWNAAEIDAAVDEAIRTLAPGGGFILFPVDAVFSDTAWDKVELLIRAWERYRGNIHT
jgi:uroporphyrinogen-III decarboxylase